MYAQQRNLNSNMSRQISHTQSRKWVNPNMQRQNEERKRQAAVKHCFPKSPVAYDFEITKHRKEYEEDMQKYRDRQLQREIEDTNERLRLGLDPIPPPIKPAFGGKSFGDNRGSVIPMKTIFCLSFNVNRSGELAKGGDPFQAKELAPWPSAPEMKYEGEERRQTEAIHRRFLALPRHKGNSTVNWQKKKPIPQYLLDEVQRMPRKEDYELDVLENTLYVPALEYFSEESAVWALGQDLVGCLNE